MMGFKVIIYSLWFMHVTVMGFAQGVATNNRPAEPRPAASGLAWPVSFTDVAAQLGVTATNVAGGERSKRYIIEANGTGVALIDYDNDGHLDLFLVNGARLPERPVPAGAASAKPATKPITAPNRLYRNDGKGHFVDVSAAAGITQSGWGNGVCAADYNNDGFLDLYVTYWGDNLLLRNTGKGGFVDEAGAAKVKGSTADQRQWSSGCTFLDYDRDGWADLFVTTYQQFDLASAPPPGKSSNCEWKGMPVFCGPRGLPFGRVMLFRNQGDGTFADVTTSSGVGEAKGFYAFTAVATDLTGDGWPDIFVASDSTPSLLFRNEKNGRFTEIGTEAGVAFSEHGFEQGGMGIAVGDYDADGQLDLMKTNFAGDHPNLFRNRGRGIFEDVVLQAGLGINPQYVAWGVGFADFDNDGWPDILQVNGHVYPELDAKADSGQERYRNPRLVYRNLGALGAKGMGRFEDVSSRSGPAIGAVHSSRGAAFGDFDNDGDVDAVVVNMNATPSLLRNELPVGTNQWVRLHLQGRKSNRAAVGAQVEIRVGDRKMRQAVLSQSSFLSHNDLRLHFGLGTAKQVDEVTVFWPSGKTQRFGPLGANLQHQLVEAE